MSILREWWGSSMMNSEWGAVAYLSSSFYGAGTGNVQLNVSMPIGVTDADGAESSYGITGCGPKSDGVLDVNEYTPSQAISEYLLSSPTVCGDLACVQWRNRPISQYNQ